MFVATSISDEILELKKQRKAILLAHHYQEPEIQELADVIGDSLELARKARDFEGDVIAFCGVWFMAETAKVLNPERIVVVPDREAGCSLVDSCPVEPVREFKRQASGLRDGQLHQYVDRGEGGERHSVHVAQRRERSSIRFPRTSRCCSCRTQPGQLGAETDRPGEHEDLAGRLHRACHLPGAPAGRGEAASIRKRKWWRIPSARSRCWRWRISSGPHRRIIDWCGKQRRRRVHRHDGERREPFAEQASRRARSSITWPTRTATAASART